MRAFAVFSFVGQQEDIILGPGDMIGRSDWAALSLADPRISEAHAMISLRGQTLKLLALRGRFRVDGKVCTDVTLRVNMSVELADGVVMICREVSLPEVLPALSVEGLPPIALTSTLSVFLDDPPRVKHGYHPLATMSIWSFGESWQMSQDSQHSGTIQIGDQWTIDGVLIEVVGVPTRQAEHPITRSVLRLPLRFIVVGDAVRVERESENPVLISGIPGRILSAALREGRAVHWQEIVECVWPNDLSLELALRRRFDVGLSRLRTCLRQLSSEGESLITLDGAGVLAMQLSAEDRVIIEESDHGSG